MCIMNVDLSIKEDCVYIAFGQCGSVKIIEFLIEVFYIDIYPEFLLNICSDKPNIVIIKYIVDHRMMDLNICDEKGLNCLMRACLHNTPPYNIINKIYIYIYIYVWKKK